MKLFIAILLCVVISGGARAQNTCASLSPPADATAMGYTKQIFCEDWTSTSSIDTADANSYGSYYPPYPSHYRWWRVSAWPTAGCTGSSPAGYCGGTGPAPTISLATVSGKVQITQTSPLPSGSVAPVFLYGCSPISSAPGYQGAVSQTGGSYIEHRVLSGNANAAGLYGFGAEILVNGVNTVTNPPFTEIDLPDGFIAGSGYNMALAFWGFTGNPAVHFGPSSGLGPNISMGVLMVPGADNNGQGVSGNPGAGVPFANYYLNRAYQNTVNGTTTGLPGTDFINVSASMHFCPFIENPGNGLNYNGDYFVIWGKPGGTPPVVPGGGGGPNLFRRW